MIKVGNKTVRIEGSMRDLGVEYTMLTEALLKVFEKSELLRMLDVACEIHEVNKDD